MIYEAFKMKNIRIREHAKKNSESSETKTVFPNIFLENKKFCCFKTYIYEYTCEKKFAYNRFVR